MKRPTLLLILLTFTTGTVLTAVAGLAGQGLTSPVAVVQTNESIAGFVSYIIVDAERQLTTARRLLPAPELVEERWHFQPPLLLQRSMRDGRADWSLSMLDARRKALLPVMRLSTSGRAQIGIDNIRFQMRTDGTVHSVVYVPFSGEIWTASSALPDAVHVVTVQPNVQFPLAVSRDGALLAVNDADALLVMNADGSNRRTFPSPLSPSWMTWSSDNQTLLLSPPDLRNPQTAYVIDIHTGDQIELINTRFVMSCGTDHIAIIEQPTGFEITRFSRIGAAHLILDTAMLDEFEPRSLLRIHPNRCDWLLVISFRGEMRLVHVGSSETIPLGRDTSFIGADDYALLYQATDGEMTEVRRLELRSGAQPEALWVYPRLHSQIRWLDGASRGLFMEGTRLKLLQRSAPDTITLTGPTAGAYSLLDD
jgi:hypothetical protein